MRRLKRISSYFNPLKVGILIGGLVLSGIGIGLRALGVESVDWLILLGILPLAWFTLGAGWFGLFELLSDPDDWPEEVHADDRSADPPDRSEHS